MYWQEAHTKLLVAAVVAAVLGASELPAEHSRVAWFLAAIPEADHTRDFKHNQESHGQMKAGGAAGGVVQSTGEADEEKAVESATLQGTSKCVSRPKSLQKGAGFLAAGIDPSWHMDANWCIALYSCESGKQYCLRYCL